MPTASPADQRTDRFQPLTVNGQLVAYGLQIEPMSRAMFPFCASEITQWLPWNLIWLRDVQPSPKDARRLESP